MKRNYIFILIFTCLSVFTQGQNKNIFIELDNSINVQDTIIFERIIDNYERFIKLPSDERVSFDLHVQNEIFEIELDEKYFGRYVTISFEEKEDENLIEIWKGHTCYLFTPKFDEKYSKWWHLTIKSHTHWLEKDEYIIQSEAFSNAVKINLLFFFK